MICGTDRLTAMTWLFHVQALPTIIRAKDCALWSAQRTARYDPRSFHIAAPLIWNIFDVSS